MENFPKSNVKFTKSLQLKKYREREKLFLVEGKKSFFELLSSEFTIEFIVCTTTFFDELPSEVKNLHRFYSTSEAQLKSVSSMKANDSVLAVVRQKDFEIDSLDFENWLLVLDDVRDPGNLGTILRTADWFGVRQIVLSPTTVEIYNPKVIQASMGSFTRMKFVIAEPSDILKSFQGDIYVADLHGTRLSSISNVSPGAIILGNESHGIGPWVEGIKHEKVTISGGGAESLNVSISAAILLHHFTQ